MRRHRLLRRRPRRADRRARRRPRRGGRRLLGPRRLRRGAPRAHPGQPRQRRVHPRQHRRRRRVRPGGPVPARAGIGRPSGLAVRHVLHQKPVDGQAASAGQRYDRQLRHFIIAGRATLSWIASHEGPGSPVRVPTVRSPEATLRASTPTAATSACRRSRCCSGRWLLRPHRDDEPARAGTQRGASEGVRPALSPAGAARHRVAPAPWMLCDTGRAQERGGCVATQVMWHLSVRSAGTSGSGPW